MGNTILIVEHDSKMIAEADMIFELGPARENREEKLFSGSYDILLSNTVTGNFFEEGFLKKKIVN